MLPLEQQIINSIRNVVDCKAPLALHSPSFRGLEKKYVADCIESSWVSSTGFWLDKFEAELASYTNTNFAVCTVNATCALHAALLSLGVKPNDEVFVPAFSFIATANAVCHAGATPHFLDISLVNLSIDTDKLEVYLAEKIIVKNKIAYNKQTHKRIPALIVVHCFGYPAHMDKLIALCNKYHIAVIEDAAEALGSYYKGHHVGTFGTLAILSFNGNKIITTGGGGAILTNNAALAKQIRFLITTAKKPHAWDYHHDTLGYNYRLPNLNAALGLAQLEQLPQFLKNKRLLHEKYKLEFAKCKEVTLLTDGPDSDSNHWLNALILSEAAKKYKTRILEFAHANNIFLRPIWKMLSKQKHLQFAPKMNLENAEILEDRIINLPSSSDLATQPSCLTG